VPAGADVVEHGRPQVEREVPSVAEPVGDELTQVSDVRACVVGIDRGTGVRVVDHAQPERHRCQRLADVMVQVTTDSGSFSFLGGDHVAEHCRRARAYSSTAVPSTSCCDTQAETGAAPSSQCRWVLVGVSASSSLDEPPPWSMPRIIMTIISGQMATIASRGR
jgi:hypothetical protein